MLSKNSENKDRRIAWAVSISLHVVLLLIFIFMIAWSEPNPPYPEYGIEVNFGTSNVGDGNKQPVTPANSSESKEEALPEEMMQEEIVEDIVEQITASEEMTSEMESDIITQEEESPVVVEETKVKEETTPKKEVVKEKVIEKVVEEKKQQEVKEPVLFEKKDGADGKTGDNTSSKNANQGDNKDTVGDKGNDQGTLDARTLYGNKGGGGGAPALNISGWFWDDIPDKKDESSENGIVEFSFIVDDEGYVGNIQIIQSTVSPNVANFYKEQLRSTTFSQTNPNVAPMTQTKGTVKFIIKSK